jgi:hypothetical protein
MQVGMPTAGMSGPMTTDTAIIAPGKAGSMSRPCETGKRTVVKMTNMGMNPMKTSDHQDERHDQHQRECRMA